MLVIRSLQVAAGGGQVGARHRRGALASMPGPGCKPRWRSSRRAPAGRAYYEAECGSDRWVLDLYERRPVSGGGQLGGPARRGPGRVIAAAALAVTACCLAAGSAGGTPGGHASWGSARHAPADNTFTAVRDLAQVKREVMWEAAERSWAEQPPMGPSRFTDRGGSRPGEAGRRAESGGACPGQVSVRAMPVAARAVGGPAGGAGPRRRGSTSASRSSGSRAVALGAIDLLPRFPAQSGVRGCALRLASKARVCLACGTAGRSS
jgi:hypothetical protein